MLSLSYEERRGQLEAYFDRTAVEAWKRLTSDAPVGRIRATVRRGRDQMRQTLLDWLPADLSGARMLDAGCGTGALAIEAACRGAHVVAVDLSPTLTELARERMPQIPGGGQVEFCVGDMLDPAFGRFDYAVAMDSLVHYAAGDVVRALAGLSARVERSALFTFAPRTLALSVMHAVGQFFPRGDRSPAIAPVSEATLRRLIAAEPNLRSFRAARTQRIAIGFYTSQAMELERI